MLEPKNFNEANKDDHWVKEMNDELDQIEKTVHGSWFIDLKEKTPLALNGSLRIS
jgi:hypothetical protein